MKMNDIMEHIPETEVFKINKQFNKNKQLNNLDKIYNSYLNGFDNGVVEGKKEFSEEIFEWISDNIYAYHSQESKFLTLLREKMKALISKE